jgi:hypothetical protein
MGCGPHEIGPAVVVFFIQHIRRDINQCSYHSFGLPILKGGINRIGRILFHHMDECIDDAVTQLILRQRIGNLGVQNRKDWIDFGIAKC